jgi:hypothetical protein
MTLSVLASYSVAIAPSQICTIPDHSESARCAVDASIVSLSQDPLHSRIERLSRRTKLCCPRNPMCPKQLKSAPGLSPIVHCEPFACVVLESSFFVILCNSVLFAVCSTRKLSWNMYVCVLNRCFEACIAGRRTVDMYMRRKQKDRFNIKET